MVGGQQALFLAALGGGVYLLTRDDDHIVNQPSGAVASEPTPGKVTARGVRTSRYSLNLNMLKSAQYRGPAERSGNGGSQSGLSKDVEERILAQLEDSWKKATGEAKRAVCMRLKAQFPNAPSVQAMNCDEMQSATFQQLAAVAGAAAGAVICGPPCSVVGALVAAWAGPKLEEWAKAAWNGMKTVGNEQGEAVNNLGDELSDYLPWNW